MSFITDGTRNLRLKCVATDVYPPPYYQWDGVTCLNNDSEQGVCITRPVPPWDDGKYVKCSARSNVSSFTGNTVYRWNLTCMRNFLLSKWVKGICITYLYTMKNHLSAYQTFHLRNFF